MILFNETETMETHISEQQINKLNRKLNDLHFHCRVSVCEITIETPVASIRTILGQHDETGRLAAQIRQAFLQGAIR